ncbi:RICIN domain-containing protein [Actinoplanes oblitus]|uniref:RICIN domain-containing protein n=1 Tax=Actinoplanes oblitus TaxID=3040509 RepID=A0ABY8WFN2_9ACTN|nr:RICIN domain-containing protein [Actinoplanes oblitus]WIM95174.1 RICIN domain-containing protein [Actinoplanes oblitus]
MRTQRRAGDDSGSLPIAMMVVATGLVLSIAVLPMIVRQVTGARTMADRNTALAGARVGLDVVLARIAAAVDKSSGKSTGLLEDLPPCDKAIEGDVGVGDEKLDYSVTVKYFDAADQEMCPVTTVPYRAELRSAGRGAANLSPAGAPAQYASRKLTGSYSFGVDNDNQKATGGSIRIDSSSVGNLCMDAVSKTPAAGAPVKARLCDGSSTQQFRYTEELYIKLVNSETDAYPTGMCVFGTTVHANGKAIVLQPCPTGTIVPDFQWSLDNNSELKSTSPTRTVENFCINLTTASKVDTPLILNSCSSNASLNVWRFDAAVGAGMAGEETYQLVNYSQFSRCLDVTNRSVTSTYMIAWFCKQDPNGVVDWNQTWYHPVPVAPAVEKKGVIYVVTGGKRYCLKSPLVATSSSWVTVTTTGCPQTTTTSLTGIPAELVWNVRRGTPSYTTSYRIEDSKGLCLQPADLKTGVKNVDLHSDGTSKVKVAVCNSSELQKWNAPANISNSSPLGDVVEVSN